jgi:hypothetical protein
MAETFSVLHSQGGDYLPKDKAAEKLAAPAPNAVSCVEPPFVDGGPCKVEAASIKRVDSVNLLPAPNGNFTTTDAKFDKRTASQSSKASDYKGDVAGASTQRAAEGSKSPREPQLQFPLRRGEQKAEFKSFPGNAADNMD